MLSLLLKQIGSVRVNLWRWGPSDVLDFKLNVECEQRKNPETFVEGKDKRGRGEKKSHPSADKA